jgi:hypothetical protein
MHNSADRTRSNEHRAGSRRNKKIKNVRTFQSDVKVYPLRGHGHR